MQERQNTKNKAGRRVRGASLYYCVAFECARNFPNKKLKRQTNPALPCLPKNRWNPFPSFLLTSGSSKTGLWPHPAMSEGSRVEGLFQITHAFPHPNDVKPPINPPTAESVAASRMLHWKHTEPTSKVCHHLSTQRFPASKPMSNEQLETQISELLLKGYFRTHGGNTQKGVRWSMWQLNVTEHSQSSSLCRWLKPEGRGSAGVTDKDTGGVLPLPAFQKSSTFLMIFKIFSEGMLENGKVQKRS